MNEDLMKRLRAMNSNLRRNWPLQAGLCELIDEAITALSQPTARDEVLEDDEKTVRRVAEAMRETGSTAYRVMAGAAIRALKSAPTPEGHDKTCPHGCIITADGGAWCSECAKDPTQPAVPERPTRENAKGGPATPALSEHVGELRKLQQELIAGADRLRDEAGKSGRWVVAIDALLDAQR